MQPPPKLWMHQKRQRVAGRSGRGRTTRTLSNSRSKRAYLPHRPVRLYQPLRQSLLVCLDQARSRPLLPLWPRGKPSKDLSPCQRLPHHLARPLSTLSNRAHPAPEPAEGLHEQRQKSPKQRASSMRLSNRLNRTVRESMESGTRLRWKRWISRPRLQRSSGRKSIFRLLLLCGRFTCVMIHLLSSLRCQGT